MHQYRMVLYTPASLESAGYGFQDGAVMPFDKVWRLQVHYRFGRLLLLYTFLVHDTFRPLYNQELVQSVSTM